MTAKERSKKLKAEFKSKLHQEPPRSLASEFSSCACVAAILQLDAEGVRLAFIRRAKSEKDPWSGQIAFPGGRKDDGDVDDIEAALREIREEVGWSLGRASFVGYLTDVQARNRSGMQRFYLRPLVFFVEEALPEPSLNALEVDCVFWVPLSYLKSSLSQTLLHFPDRGGEIPGIKLPEGDILWGLTHIIFQEMVQVLARSI